MNPVVRERFRGLERALKLQAREYERRLETLNHEGDRIKENQEKSVSADKFDGAMHNMNGKFDALQKEINELKEFRNLYQGRSTWTEKYIPWGISIILAILLALLSYYQVRQEL